MFCAGEGRGWEGKICMFELGHRVKLLRKCVIANEVTLTAVWGGCAENCFIGDGERGHGGDESGSEGDERGRRGELPY